MHRLKRFSCMIVTVIILNGSGYVYAENDNSDIKQEYVTFTEKNNIKTEDMRKKSQINEDKLKEYLSRVPNLSGIEGALINAQEEYGVNAILLLAIIRLESGNGRSNLATSKNNLGGLVSGGYSVTVYRSFDTKDECVIFMAQLLSENYLNDSGKFFSGYTLADIAKRYSVSKAWSDLVCSIMYEIQLGLG